MNILEVLEKETGGHPYNSYRFCVDREIKLPVLDYEAGPDDVSVRNYGETDKSFKTRDMTERAKELENHQPLFKYFLDGSRRTYKVYDIEYNKRFYPVVAGQIGVTCSRREQKATFRKALSENLLVLSLPTDASPESKNNDVFFNNLLNKINAAAKLKKFKIAFSKILPYSSSESKTPYLSRGIVEIQNQMMSAEKKVVLDLAGRNSLDSDNYLMKDGSLEYRKMKGEDDAKTLSKIRNNYRWVVGVSKSFNPELIGNQSDLIAKLKPKHRTKAFIYHPKILGDETQFAVWYVRIRDMEYTPSPFAGVLKIEKILTGEEVSDGVETSVVDTITANIINERNPVCYGRDQRWANHLYPIYITETYIKNSFFSDLHFLNLF